MAVDVPVKWLSAIVDSTRYQPFANIAFTRDREASEAMGC